MAFAVSNVAVTNGAGGSVLIAANAGRQRKRVIVFNNGPNAITLGVDNTVTTGNGFLVPAAASLAFNPGDVAVQAIAATAAQVSPADTRVLEEF